MKDFLIRVGENKLLRILITLIGILFGGVLGSFLWESYLSVFLKWLSSSSLKLLSSLFSGYLDSLHSGIGNDPSALLSFLPFLFLMITVISSPWVFLLIFRIETRHISKYVTEEESNKMYKDYISKDSYESSIYYKKAVTYVAIAVGITATLVFGNILNKTGYIYEASSFVEKSIDILAPHLSNTETLELRAKYRLVDNAEQFYELEDILNEMALESNVKLPTFESIK